jgi:MYXO-CTERM domain-containing protein
MADIGLGQTGLVGEAREWVLAAAMLLWSLLLGVTVVGVGVLLGLKTGGVLLWDAASFALAVGAGYAIAAAVRTSAGEGGFETDHALPQLTIAVGLLAVATAQLGVSASVNRPAHGTWRIAFASAWILLLGLTLFVIAAGGTKAPGSLFAFLAVAAAGLITLVRRRRVSPNTSRSNGKIGA